MTGRVDRRLCEYTYTATTKTTFRKLGRAASGRWQALALQARVVDARTGLDMVQLPAGAVRVSPLLQTVAVEDETWVSDGRLVDREG